VHPRAGLDGVGQRGERPDTDVDVMFGRSLRR